MKGGISNRFILGPLIAASLVASAADGEVRFTMHDGRVAIMAKDASVAEILAEWARIGRTKIINADRLPADRVTLELQNVSEQQALDILLRATSGYLALPRAAADPGASLFDRIAIMPPSAPPPVANASAKPPNPRRLSPAPADPTPVVAEQPAPVARAEPADGPKDENNDELPAPVVVGGALPLAQIAERQSTFSSRQMLEVANPRDFKLPPMPAGNATAAPAGALPPGMGAAVPGMITLPARQPDVPRIPRQPLPR